MLNTGFKKIYSKNRLLTTIAYRINGKTTYAMEGSIFIAGAGVQWLRDRMKFFKKAPETEKIVKSLKDNNNIYLVPAFTGLGAPYWDANARGVLSGLTRDTSPKEIVRATIEAVAYQTFDLFEAMKHDGLRPKIVKVDGNKKPTINNLNINSVVRGDQKIPEISAASILAKVSRDRLIKKMSKKFKAYLWDKNIGYGTRDHLLAIKKFGITKHHRKTFKPIHNILSLK